MMQDRAYVFIAFGDVGVEPVIVSDSAGDKELAQAIQLLSRKLDIKEVENG